MFNLFKRKEQPIDVIEHDEDAIKLNTVNGTVTAKRILSVNGKHVVYIDQYGNLKEALLK
jgi:hypothetical protein